MLMCVLISIDVTLLLLQYLSIPVRLVIARTVCCIRLTIKMSYDIAEGSFGLKSFRWQPDEEHL